MQSRLLPLLFLLSAGLAGVAWIVNQGRLEPADFAFANETEVQSLDPAVVSGQPEGRIIWSIYEALVQLDPEDRSAKPGVAESWEVSEDGRTYTWAIRKDAKWSNGEPLTAEDFEYTFRRFLDPTTGAKYAQAMWYVTGARKYSQGASGLKVGDAVEIELHQRPEGALTHARGQMLRGELLSIDRDTGYEDAEVEAKDYTRRHSFLVAVDGEERRFHVTVEPSPSEEWQDCKAILLDFSEVGIRAPNPYTLITELESPTPFWPELIGFYAMSPVNKTCIETHGSPDWTYPENIVTNGPYEVQFRRIRDRIRLVKSPTYWNRDKVSFNVIDAMVIEQTVTQFNMYETGQIDWVPKVSPLISRELMAADPPRPDYNPGVQLATYFYAFNVTRPPYNDVRVRRALAMALDRDEIIATAGAGEMPARTMVPPGIPGYTPQPCPPEDIEEAQRLMAEAGYPGGEGFARVQILYNSGFEQHETIAELVRKQWEKNLGITVSTRKEEWGTFLNSTSRLNFEVARRAWIGDYTDANTFLDLFEGDNGNNQTGFDNPEYNDLIKAAGRETDAAKRQEILMEAERLLMSEVPVVPIYTYVSRSLVRPSIQGFWNNLQDSHPLHTLYRDDELTGPNNFMEDAVPRKEGSR